VKMRPEAEQKLRQGFQRRVDEHSSRYAEQLADADRVAMMHECGEVVGVFTARAGGGVRPRAYVVGLLPLAAIPLLIALGAIDVPGMTSLLILSPFLIGGWFGLSIWRGRKPRRRSWLYAFTDGFVVSDDPRASAFPVRWSQVTDVSVIWTVAYEPGADGEGRPVVSGYSLRCTDGQALEIPRSFQNVRDPYGELGRSLRRLLPIAVGDTMPQFPTIDEVVAVYAPRPTGS
jgi:hypothetical protein